MQRSTYVGGWLVITLLILGRCGNGSFRQHITVPASTQGIQGQVDLAVAERMNQYNIPGLAIGVVRNDTVLYCKGYGVRSIRDNTPVTAASVFHTASVSKLFTALAVVQLVSEGRLRLDDRLTELLPELSFDDARARDITLRSMLNHTSGIPDVRNYHWSNHHTADSSLVTYLSGLRLSLDFPPGTRYAYSNLAYDILGHVVARASGRTFEDYVQASILQPAGMHSSDFRYFRIADSLRTSPHGKRWMLGTVYRRSTYPYTREHAPSSTLNASAADLLNWMLSFMRRLEKDTTPFLLRQMTRESTPVFSGIGLGFQLYDWQGKKAIGHYGGDKGFRSFLLMIPAEKTGIVVLGNADYHEDFRQEIAQALYAIIQRTTGG
jgi:CubicO group peptidase (beta-lactamase class C family)